MITVCFSPCYDLYEKAVAFAGIIVVDAEVSFEYRLGLSALVVVVMTF